MDSKKISYRIYFYFRNSHYLFVSLLPTLVVVIIELLVVVVVEEIMVVFFIVVLGIFNINFSFNYKEKYFSTKKVIINVCSCVFGCK